MADYFNSDSLLCTKYMKINPKENMKPNAFPKSLFLLFGSVTMAAQKRGPSSNGYVSVVVDSRFLRMSPFLYRHGLYRKLTYIDIWSA